MRVYRGPRTTHFGDSTHELVSIIPHEKLEASIRDGSVIEFNISKDAANERQSKCTAYFEDEDLIPVINGFINGLMSKIKLQQTALREIETILSAQDLSEEDKLEKIREALPVWW